MLLLSRQIAAEQAVFNYRFDGDQQINLNIILKLTEFLGLNHVYSITDIQIEPASHYYGGAVLIPATYDGQGDNYISTDGLIVVSNIDGEYLKGGFSNSINVDLSLNPWISSADNNSPGFFHYSQGGYNYDINPAATADGTIYFVCRKTKQGAATFGGSLREFFADLGPIVPVALAVATVFTGGAATLLGNELLGSIGVADAALSPIVGNLAIGTVTSGGNVQKALTNAVSSYASIGVSDIVVDSTSVQVLGSVAGAATTAAINGGDIKSAIYKGSLSNALGSIGAITGTNIMDTYTNENGDTVTTDAAGNETIAYADGQGYGVYNADGSSYTLDAQGNIVFSSNGNTTVDNQGNVLSTTSPTPTATGNVVFSSSPTGLTWDNIDKFLQRVPAIANVIKGKPPISSNRIVTANGVQTPNKNGTISTISTNGKTTVTRMPTGQSYSFPDGSYVFVDAQNVVHNFNSQGVETVAPLPANVASAGGMGLLVAMGVGLLLIK